MIDTHSHIDFEEYQENFEEFLNEIKNEGVEKVIIPGVEPSTFDRIIDLCKKYDMLHCALGVHPSEFQTYNEQVKDRIYALSKNSKVVALGEIGLDYHYGAQDKEEQKKLLIEQLEIAQELKLPVIIHDRESHEDCYNILGDFELSNVIFHCFSGDRNFALKCLDRGYYIALGGIVTFKNALEMKETAKIIPLERLLLETDAPYLTPVPFRSKINSPKYLKYIAQTIADLRLIDVETVKNKTTENAKKVFGI